MAKHVTHLRWNNNAACNVKGHSGGITAVAPKEFWNAANKCKRCIKVAERLARKFPESFGLQEPEKAEPVTKAVKRPAVQKSKAPKDSPTLDTYNPLQHAYDVFNTYLFKGELPDCLITLQQSGQRVIAYYKPQAFKSKLEEGKFTDEIAFNPAHLSRTDLDTLSTMLHEVIHLWRNLQPKPSRRGYHDKVWAAKMKELGLQPVNCDNPEREVGHKVSHTIIPGGQFEHLATDLLNGGWKLSWTDSAPSEPEGGTEKPKAKKKQTRAKYTCPCCEQNAWAKHGANLKCGECYEEMQLAE